MDQKNIYQEITLMNDTYSRYTYSHQTDGAYLMGYTRSQRQYLSAVGKTIRAIRTRKRLTQESLANLSGLHRTYIGAIERGERNVSILNMRVLADALGEEVAMIVTGKSNA
jgi:DNA-binding XRE family transcriptional regulator